MNLAMSVYLLIAATVALYNHLGLSDEVARLLRLGGKLREVATCSKCMTFWISLLASSICSSYDVLASVFFSLVASYTAIWIELALGVLNALYEKIWKLL